MLKIRCMRWTAVISSGDIEVSKEFFLFYHFSDYVMHGWPDFI